MDKQSAVKLIRETFEQPFDQGKFTNLSKNLVKHLDESKKFSYQGNYIPDAYEQSIKRYDRIGQYTDPEGTIIDILTVYLKEEHTLEYARTRLRNFIAWYLNGSRGGKQKDAALVAFVSPENIDWRFSLVKMEYNLAETDSGKVKVEKELTPVRRYSFLVGENESSHTAQMQLLDILMDDTRKPALSDFEKAFSIEVVTKEFFTKYKELYLAIKESLEELIGRDAKVRNEFTSCGMDTVGFAKKLLGQIVFLYFLQKKGWFGVGRDAAWGTGPKDFLRRLFEKKNASYSNFFNDILEPLFYEALAIERTDDFYSRFNCKIPFLNGGLFDPINNYDWVHVDIPLPNGLFSNTEKTKEGDTGTGILDVFDRYNFTVKEDEPLEKEVAIDPEMLGKVFENMLDVKDRKSKGTYYTPREIVHYMCQESLINYLDTALNSGEVALAQEKPANLKLFGAPAFQQQALKTPGNINRVFRQDIEDFIRLGELVTENDITAIKKQTEIEQGNIKSSKYQIILRSIREHAQEIDDALANVRVCDPAIGSGAFPVGLMTEIVRARNTLTKYLPDKTGRTNYHFKRHAIRKCLYGVDIDPGAVEIAKLRLWLSLVVDEEDIKQIQPLPNLDYKIVCGNSLLGVGRDMFNNDLFQQLEKLIPLHCDETNNKKKQEYKNQIDQLILQLTNNKKVFDFEVYFSEVFHKKGGFDIVIANPPYGFRNVLTPEEKIHFRKVENISFSSGDSAELFSKKCFDKLVASKGLLTFIIPKKSLYGDAWGGFRKDYWKKYKLIFLLDVSKAFEEVLFEESAFSMAKIIDGNETIKLCYLTKEDSIFEFANASKHEIFMSNGTVQIYKALCPGSLFTKIQSLSAVDKLVSGELGLAIGTDFFSDTPKEYKLLKGIDIDRWFIKQPRYLANKQKLKWKDAKKFLTPKIISQVLIAHIENPEPHIKITACYDDEGIIITNTLTSFKLDQRINNKFWLAYLNSKLVSWYAYNFIYSRAIRTMHFYNFYIQQLPIPMMAITDLKTQSNIANLVDQILTITKDEDYLSNPDKQAKVKEFEYQIDQMVYELYGLTKEEIAIVEGKR